MTIDTSKTIAAAGTGDATASCWSCGDMRAAHFCHACGKVQPPLPVNYFSFFGLPRKLNMDVARLEREFYELSRKLHPDLYARADKREQEWSLEQSSLLNDAYRTLKDPIKRTAIPAAAGRRGTRRAIEDRDREGARQRRSEETDRASRPAGGSVRTEHAARRAAHEQEDGRGRSRAGEEIWKRTGPQFERKYEELAEELKRHWNHWDQAVDRRSDEERRAARTAWSIC